MNKHTTDGAGIGQGRPQGVRRSGSGQRPERIAERVLGHLMAIAGAPSSGDALVAAEGPGNRRETPAVPPLTNRGVSRQVTLGPALTRGVDFLTVSMPSNLGLTMRLRDVWSHIQTHGYQQGFKLNERLTGPGGEVVRRWDPQQASKRWGTAYESWQMSGAGATGLARRLRGQDCKFTRGDVAWDFECQDDYTPESLLDELGGWTLPYTLGVAGENGVFTRYIGGKQSERMIRIYRKDRQDPVAALTFGAHLRVELVLKGSEAERWQQAWDISDDEGYGAAAAIVEHMTGWRPQGDIAQIPERKADKRSAVVAGVLTFLDQYALQLAACNEAGIPITELAWLKVMVGEHHQRQRTRFDREVQRLKEAGPSEVTTAVRDILQAKLEANSSYDEKALAT